MDTEKALVPANEKNTNAIVTLVIFLLGLGVVALTNQFFFQQKVVPTDSDSDGFFVVEYEELEKDCDDGDDSIYPGAKEIPGDGIDQDCDGEDAPFEFDPEDVLGVKEYPEFDEFLSMRQLEIYSLPIITPNSISDSTIKSISKRIETRGLFKKAYLRVIAGVGENDRPLGSYDSVYLYFDTGNTGGHLLRSSSFQIPGETISTSLLYSADRIPVINLPYTDNPREDRITKLDLLQVLNSENHGYNHRHYIGAFVSTKQFGRIVKFTVAYECADESDCSIKLIN